MESFVIFFFGILSLLAAYMGFKLTQSAVVAILAMICGVMIGKSLQVPVLLLWDKFSEKYFPLPRITHFYEERFEQSEDSGLLPIALGMRVLICTEEMEYTEENSALFFKMVEFAIEALREKYPLFAVRADAVEKRKSPVQYNAAVCGHEGALIAKCYKAWGKTEAVFKMTARAKEKDLFLHDGGINVNGTVTSYAAFVLFDASLPQTVTEAYRRGEENPAKMIPQA